MPDIAKTFFERHRRRLSRAVVGLCALGYVIFVVALQIWLAIDWMAFSLMIAGVLMLGLARLAFGASFFVGTLPVDRWLRALYSRLIGRTRADG
jgi:hypothetical protein